MSAPHRAQPEVWLWLARHATPPVHSDLVELRERIKALEVAQQPHRDKLDRLIALDRKDDTPDPAVEYRELSDEEATKLYWGDSKSEQPEDAIRRIYRAGWDAAIRGPYTPADPTAHKLEVTGVGKSAEPTPAGALAERVMLAAGCSHEDACEAIRAVAAWLKQGRLLHAVELLEQEADRG